MGKGNIISGGSTGLYLAESVYRKDLKDAQIEILDGQITHYQTVIPATPDGREKNILIALLLSVTKRKQYLEDNFPDDFQQQIWCADLTENLTGDIGLIEIPGEKTNLNIVPGFSDDAAWDPERDGQLTPTISMSPAQAWYNLAILPGWQKWKPTYRYATINSIDGDTADIILDPATSTQQGLDVNQGSILAAVPIAYMDCDGAAFSPDDVVIVKFTGQDYAVPSIIGFKEHPQPCEPWLEIETDEYVSFYKINTGETKNGIPKNGGGTVDSPALKSEISIWYNANVKSHTSIVTIFEASSYTSGAIGAKPQSISTASASYAVFPDKLPIIFPDDYIPDTTNNIGGTPGTTTSSGEVLPIRGTFPCTDPQFGTTGDSFISILTGAGSTFPEYSRIIFSNGGYDNFGFTVDCTRHNATEGIPFPFSPGQCQTEELVNFDLNFFSPFAAGEFNSVSFFDYLTWADDPGPAGIISVYEALYPTVNHMCNIGRQSNSNQFGVCIMGLEYVYVEARGGVETNREERYDTPVAVCYTTRDMSEGDDVSPWDMSFDSGLTAAVDDLLDVNDNPTTAVGELGIVYKIF